MKPEEIQAEWDAFIDYPEGSGKLYVTTTSALIFARSIVEMAEKRERDKLRTQNQALLTERDCAIQMLADWCVAVHGGGTEWDYWDEHYKDAMYLPNPIRELLDAAISKAQAEGGV